MENKSRFSRAMLRVEELLIVHTIRSGLVNIIPILTIGAFALILQTFPVEAYQRFLETGAGSFLIDDAIRQKADIYLTGDMKYHDFQRAEGRITLVDIGHFESEQFTKQLIYSIISKKFSTFACFISERGRSFVNYI